LGFLHPVASHFRVTLQVTRFASQKVRPRV
jgi:hypothetical protein